MTTSAAEVKKLEHALKQLKEEGTTAKKMVASLKAAHAWIADEEGFFGKVRGARACACVCVRARVCALRVLKCIGLVLVNDDAPAVCVHAAFLTICSRTPLTRMGSLARSVYSQREQPQ